MYRHIRNIILLFIIVLIQNHVFAQKYEKIKYKEIMEAIYTKNKEAVYSMLLAHQKKDPFHANTYFQLGIIAAQWAKDYDPLTDIQNVKYFIYNTKLYFGHAKAKCDEREFRRHKKFYYTTQISRDSNKIQFDDVKRYIEDQLKAIDEYDKNVMIITSNYNSSVKHYNECIRLFMLINKAESKIKNIFLTADKEMINNLNKLSVSYDSTIYFFQEYKTAIKNYPIKKYNQSLKILPIQTYRLEGLTSSDFLQDIVPIWDYGTWVKEVMKVLNKEIVDLRTNIDETNHDINKKTSFYCSTNEFKEYDKYLLDEKLIFKIGKYDQESMIVPLLQYKEAKLNYLIKFKQPINDTKSTAGDITMQKRAAYYQELIDCKHQADSLCRIFNSFISPKSVQKYQDFVQKNYGNIDSLKTFTKKETDFLALHLDTAFQYLQIFLIRDLGLENDTSYILYNKEKIYLSARLPDFSNKDVKFHTASASIDKYGNYYLGGYFKMGNIIQSFIAKTNKKEKIDWIKINPSAMNMQDCYMFVKAFDNGCVALLSSFNENSCTNTIIKFDETGKQITKKEISSKNYPRYFVFDDLNETVLVATKGLKMDAFDDFSGNLSIFMVNLSDEKKNWNTEIEFDGNLIDILKMDKNFFVFSNFTKYNSKQEVLQSKAGVERNKTNTILTILDENGQIIKHKPYYSESPYFSLKAVKINSNVINLLGIKKEAFSINKSTTNLPKLKYSLINLNGDEFYKN